MKTLLAALAATLLPLAATAVPRQAHVATNDSIYLEAYTTGRDNHHDGLHLRWSNDQRTWFDIGQQYTFVKSDYGRWGAEKRMFNPQLTRLDDGRFLLLFRVGEQNPAIAITTTQDFHLWTPQDYYLPTDSRLTSVAPASLIEAVNKPLIASGSEADASGTIVRIARHELTTIEDGVLRAQTKNRENDERAIYDGQRWPGLQAPVSSKVTISKEGARTISDKLLGIFFEDISYAADGGLYAEMVQNRDFEYKPSDRGNNHPEWCATHSWTLSDASGKDQTLVVSEEQPLHPNNPHHAVITPGAEKLSLSNTGWDGISLKAGALYDLSLQLRLAAVPGAKAPQARPVQASIVAPDGTVIAQSRLSGGRTGQWSRLKCQLKAKADCSGARLVLAFEGQCEYHVDMVSLFPRDTYKGRPNGMRRDLAETLEALHPRFIRFPGGCVAHGDGIGNIYRWKNTIGALESRVPDRNLWNYHQTMGLGYYEYFQFCEDLGAQPLPVLAAGVPCQNSGTGTPGHEHGQQDGIPLGAEMDQYIQDVLDLIEWANGDPKTSPWARLRAEAGHPKPFGLKMVGIGNEDLISQVFEERFRLIYQAVRSQYPDIEVVGTVGPFWEGSDYEEGWRFAHELQVPTVDEHYYNTPGWFINNQQFYDHYPRLGTQVYLGEYAAHVPGRPNNIETALAEALHLCNVERNGDLVTMTSYAPLLARKGHTSWNPDLIYFDNDAVNPTTGYEVQRLFGQYSGTTWLPQQVSLSLPPVSSRKLAEPQLADVQRRIATSCVYDEVHDQYIVRLVNYLPVPNQTELCLPFLTDAKVIGAEQLSGALIDLEVKATTDVEIQQHESAITTTLPPYSFTVIVVK